MTVALVLAGNLGEDDAGQQQQMLCGQLAALGVRRVDAAERTGPGLLTVAAAARAAGDRVLICAGAQTVPGPVLARLLGAGGTAAVTRLTASTARGSSPGSSPGFWSAQPSGALIVDLPDLDALARSAETLAATQAGPDPGTAVGALIDELGRRGVTVRILDAGPDSEGAVTQLLADPAARDMARWAAWRRLTPAALYGISLALGLVAAVWFAELDVRAKLLAIPALAGSFLFARTGSLVAATSRDGRISPLVGWLGIACGLLTEPALYAALAVSSRLGSSDGLDGTFGGALRNTFVATWGGTGQAGVWRLAIAALLLLGVRKLAGLGYERTAGAPGNLFPRSALRTLEQAITFPAGERYAVIVLTSVFFGPRLTFLILLGWGVLGAGYLLAGQIARSAGLRDAAGAARSRRPDDDEDNGLAAYRGDGVLAHWAGALVDGRIPPLPPVLVGLLVTGMLAALGLGNLPGILVLTPIEAMMLAALGSRHPHDGRLDWLAPALLLAGEGVFLGALGLARQVTPWVVFALLAAVLVRHLDLACRARAGRGVEADVLGLGWEGRMLLAGVAATAGLVPFAYPALAGYLWLLFIWEFLTVWLVPANPELADGDNA
ncbi:MAG TPA: hypothetical protein VHS30_38730 [Streptosporangiaceae bacterium]|nr:hypothetical protein [Streptosporangiaceae bacterium]